MVHVPIDDEHAFDTVLDLGIARSDRGVVEETKTHGMGDRGVMSGGLTRPSALLPSPFIAASTPAIAAPAASLATSKESRLMCVSASMK